MSDDVTDPAGSMDAGPWPEGDGTLHDDIETKHYSDGTSATGPGPLPDLSPRQQGAHGPFSPEMWDHLKAWVRRELHLVGAGSEATAQARDEANP